MWYSIKNPEQATIFPIKVPFSQHSVFGGVLWLNLEISLWQGEVEGIERAEGRTEVLVDEGSSAVIK